MIAIPEGHENCGLCILATRVQARIRGVQRCSYRSCMNEATATVLVASDRKPVCFTHEREYADRYGCSDIIPVLAQGGQL